MKIALKKNTRAAVLCGALVVTLIATVVSGREKPGGELVVPASERAAAQIAAQPAVVVADEDLDLGKLQRARKDDSIGELFTRDAEPAQQANAGAAAGGTPAKPAEPAFPFQYLGHMVDQGKVSVFLAKGDEPIVAAPGQSLDHYRLDAVSDTTVSFTDVTTGARKVLQIAAQN
jgi:hypothetical protein